VDIISILATCIVLVSGGLLVINGNVIIGVVVAFMTYVNRFFVPIRELSQIYTTLQAASAGGARVLELLDTEPNVSDRPGAVPIDTIKGDISFRNISFRYLEDEPVLEGVSFDIPAGSTAAIVGPTGAGKTTITNLISRFYQTDAGLILLDGKDIRDITIDSLHEVMGYVPQDPYLFPGTIADNIAFGKPSANREEIAAAAEAAHIDTFVRRLPDAYDTRISEGGANLSVGQRQLICIARAILVDPKILLMDEATASVDSITEAIIQKALDTLLKGRTALVIAHRLSTIRNAGIIYVIEHGRITESGTHEELNNRNGTYRDLYKKQFISQVATGA
jgi:ATP-binding cassette, subfamily B, multidrug efflux pump